MSHTPLVVLTADRPPELRGCGAPQTIDQINLYGRYPLYFCDCPVPDWEPAGRAAWIDEAERAMRAAMGHPRGPVHLNLPFREPLIPEPSRVNALARAIGDSDARASNSDDTAQSCPEPDAGTWDELAAKIRGVRRGLIVCGPQNSTDALSRTVSRLREVTGFPVVADIASQVRCAPRTGVDICSRYDLILKNSQFAAALAPEVVLRIGGLPTSKTLNLWLSDVATTDHIIVDDQPEIADPYRQATRTVVSPLNAIAEPLAKRLEGVTDRSTDYASLWADADEWAASLLETMRARREEPFEGDFARAVFTEAPDGTVIYLSNSMPIRLADTYASARHASLRVLFNRGANGIDGIVSSAVGAAVAMASPVVLVTGDLALLHDLNGLLMARQYDVDLKIVLLNNDGGGIFSFLPIAEHAEVAESLVAMPHGCNFAHAARLYDLPQTVFETVDAFTTGYKESIARPGPAILEVRSDRRRMWELTQEIYQRFETLNGGKS
jgi:2-succinyl-5-enolpyruvyl-6-hydroxy-3-cyclohexene-1-carboxylate synthase